jgi:hypothetical protein
MGGRGLPGSGVFCAWSNSSSLKPSSGTVGRALTGKSVPSAATP